MRSVVVVLALCAALVGLATARPDVPLPRALKDVRYHDGQACWKVTGAAGCNVHGCWKNGGGCNVHGCWDGPRGSCTVHGCWSHLGGCNVHGCWDSPLGACTVHGCSDRGVCSVHGCP